MHMKMFNIKDNLLTLVFLVGNLCVLLAEPIPLQETDLLNHHHQDGHQPRPRVRRQYYVCPPDFERISSNCYYFSRHMATWQDALYDCIDRHSELAILQNPAEDKKLRGQLNKSPKPLEWWIGGIYDWEQMKWKWGASGKQLTYHGFSRMGPENKDKLKWHCTILDPTMRYKWSARSCVLGKHYICQKKVMRVGKRGLDKLRKKYNNTLNEVPAPIYEKPRKPKKQENQSNGSSKHLKQHNYRAVNNAYGHRRNNTEIRKNRKNHKNRKNKNKNFGLHIRNGTDFSGFSMENGYQDYRKNKKRNRRYKSKESKESKENNSLEEEFQRKWKKNNKSIDGLTQKTTFMTNTLSPFHPQVIVEQHDFLELNHN